MKRVAVVGAGISGLICAYELKRAGFDVEVFEKASFVGGRMATRTKDDLPFDIGANHLCNLYDEMQKYCEELEIPWDKMAFQNYGICHRGKTGPIGSTMDLVTRVRMALFSFFLKRDTDFFNLSSAVHYDDDTAYDFFTGRIGLTASNYLADSMVSSYQFHRADEMSKGALMAYMQSIKADKSRWDLHKTRGLMSALPEALAKKLDVHLSTPVTNISSEDSGVRLETESDSYTFDAVVLASTANSSLSLIDSPTPLQQELLSETRYAATISLAFRVRKDLLPPQSVVWVPYVESRAISSYSNELMKGEEVVSGDDSLLCVWLHEAFALSLMDKPDHEIFSAAKEELHKICDWLPSEDVLRDYDLYRWTHAMPKFSQGHLKRVNNFFVQGGQGENRLFLCGDYLNRPWTEGALRCGKDTAKQVQDVLSPDV